MARLGRRCSGAFVLATFCVVVALAGCMPASPAPHKPTPKLTPPAIRTAGVLRVATDLSYPPFAGLDGAQKAGIDVDVASAIAGRLGLEVRFVDVKASDIATALSAGDADIALSAPFSADILSRDAIAGTYVADGPALFGRAGGTPAAVSTQTAVDQDSAVIGAQQDSEAYWQLVALRGTDGVRPYGTLKDALQALDHGDVDYVGGDALVGAYIARDLPSVRFLGALAPAHLLGVAVPQDNDRLAQAMRSTLDRLSADGVLDTVRSAWVGSLPRLPLPGEDASAPASAVSSAAAGSATATP